MSTLFRKAATEYRGHKYSNPIHVDGVPSVNTALIYLAAFFAALLIFGLKVDYKRKISVAGFIAPEGGDISLTTENSGRLNILVSNGASVTAGQQIATIQSDQFDSAGSSVQKIEINSLKRRLTNTSEQLNLASTELRAIEPDLAVAQIHVREKINIVKNQNLLARDELDITDKNLARQTELLNEGITAEISYEEAKLAKVKADQKILSIQEQIVSLDSENSRLRRDATEESNQLRNTIIRLKNEKEIIMENIRQIRSTGETAILAPVDGVLTYARARHHDRAAAGQTLFKIREDGSELIGVLLATSKAIGFLKKGDNVYIRYEAFGYQEHGVFAGIVIDIDKVALAPSEIEGPLQVSEPTFRVFTRLEQSPQSKVGTQINLSQGMRFEASVVIDTRPVIWWLLDPVA